MDTQSAPDDPDPQIVDREDNFTSRGDAEVYNDKRVEGFTAVGLFLASFLLYFCTLPPTVVGGDSGEIVVAAWKLALPHPPGELACR